MTTLPLVSLIILNYNQAELTCDLLETVQRLSYPNLEVIVVDNKSMLDPTPIIRARQFSNLQIILNDTNLGFAGGNNEGMRQARGDYFLILNNDTEVTPDLVEQLLVPFATDETIGVTCPKIRYYEHPTVIQYAGYTSLNPYTGQATAIGTHQEDWGQFDEGHITPFAHGAAMLVKRRVVEKVGLMPDLYFLYYEELDWCCRIKQAGYRIYYQPLALVYHKESMTVGKSNPMKVYYHTRNRILFMRRNVSGLTLSVFLVYYAGLALPKAIVQYGLAGQFTFMKALLRGVSWHLKHAITKPSLTDRIPSAIIDHLPKLTTSL